MAESHEPRPPFTGTPAAPPAAPIQSVHSFITPPAERPGRLLVLRRTIRLLARRWLYVMMILFRWMRPFIGFVAAVAALLAVILWMSVQLWWPASTASQDVRVAALPPSSAVEHYIQGQQTFNADLMWESLSTEAQAARLQNGASKLTMQSQVDQDRLRGVQFLHYDYIGGVKLRDGGTMFFYAVDLDTPERTSKLPFTFVADKDGKVRGLIAPEY